MKCFKAILICILLFTGNALAETASDQKENSKPDISVELSGTLTFNNLAISELTDIVPELRLSCQQSGKYTYVDNPQWSYDINTGRYTIYNLPLTKVWLSFRFQTSGEGISPGNYLGANNTDLTSLPKEQLQSFDIVLKQIIKLNKPIIDNNLNNRTNTSELPLLASRLSLSWEPVEGAKYYNLRIREKDQSNTLFEFTSVKTEKPQATVILRNSLDYCKYQMKISAYNSEDEEIGLFLANYKDCISQHYDFRVKAEQPVHNGHYYLVISKNVSWKQARELCKDLGGNLACVNSEQEMNHICTIVNQNNYPEGSFCWLGGYLDKNNQWQWVTRESFDIPVKIPPSTNDNERYLNMQLETSNWQSCPETGEPSGKQQFICEWESIDNVQWNALNKLIVESEPN